MIRHILKIIFSGIIFISFFVSSSDLYDELYTTCEQLPSRESDMESKNKDGTNCEEYFPLYTHNPKDLQDITSNIKETSTFCGRHNYLNTIEPINTEDIVSLHDTFERDGEFWDYYDENSGQENGIPMTVMKYFKDNPETLKSFSQASAIYPEAGYYSVERTGTLYGVLTNIFLLIKKSKKKNALIAYEKLQKDTGYLRQCANPLQKDVTLTSCENEVKEKIYYQGYQSNTNNEVTLKKDEYDEILTRIIACFKPHQENITQLSIKKKICSASSDSGLYRYTTEQLKKAIESDQPLGSDCRMMATREPNLLDFKSSLFSYLKKTKDFNDVAKLRLFINNYIGAGGIDDFAVLLNQGKPISKYNVPKNEFSCFNAINVDELTKYINRNNGQEEMAHVTLKPPGFNFKNRSVALTDVNVKEGIFFISTGASVMEPGVQQLVKKTPISATELSNEGGAKLSVANMEKVMNDYVSSFMKTPDYLGIGDLHFISFYSNQPLFSSILQVAGNAVGFEKINLHPELKIKEMTERSFDFRSLFEEGTVRTFKEAVSNVNDLEAVVRME